MSESVLKSFRPLHLGRRKSEAASEPPKIPLPPVPVPPLPVTIPPSTVAGSETGSDVSMMTSNFEVRHAQLKPKPYEAIVSPTMPTAHTRQTSTGNTVPLAPTPMPPFRLLTPSILNKDPSPSSEPPRVLSLYSEPGLAPPNISPASHSPSRSITPRPPMAQTSSGPVGERARVLELRARPLNQSEYGRLIVNLLTMPWYKAPSGLAVTLFPEGTSEADISNVASAINLLVCGSEAFKNVHAGVLGVYSLPQLNRLLVRSGLSPIVPQDPPSNWSPFAARQPPDFLMEGFSATRKASMGGEQQ